MQINSQVKRFFFFENFITLGFTMLERCISVNIVGNYFFLDS
jgi:hypothetical protein